MMDSRLGWMLLGAVFGFILGYVVRSLKEIKEQVDKVDRHITGEPEDSGYSRGELISRIALFAVVLLTAFSAFQSQRNTNNIKDQQKSLDRSVSCTQQFTAKLLMAVNARTQFSQAQSKANLNLQKAQSSFLKTLFANNETPTVVDQKVVQAYLAALNTYTSLVSKSSAQAVSNPYPDATDFIKCIKTK